MNILIYIPDIDQSYGGVRQYSIAMIQVLAQDLSNSYFIYHNCADAEIKNLLNAHKHLRLVTDEDVNLSRLSHKINYGKEIINTIYQRLDYKFRFKIKSVVDRITEMFYIDIIHSPYQFIPESNRAKLVVTLYDVQEIHFPEFFTAEERAFRAVHFLDYLRKSDSVIVSYNHIKADIVKYFAVPADKISVILLDMSKLWFERFDDKNIIECGELDLPEKFIFYPANTWEHKNHSRLVQAVALLRDKYDCAINLVCSGHQTTHYHDSLSYEVKKYKLENSIKFVGVVDEQVLFSLYQNCLGVIVPTLYEAGSFPLMESILLKVPVICSNVTSLPETIEDEQFVFDPFQVNDIANKLKQLWESNEFRRLSVQNSIMVGQKLRNTGAFNKFMTLYQNIVS